MGTLEELYRSPAPQLEERTVLRPFPQVDPATADRAIIWERYRQEMIQKAGFAIFLAGNKLDEATNTVVEANGVVREFDIAVGRGVYPIAIGATGHVAEKLAAKVLADLPKYYGPYAAKVQAPLSVLCDVNAGPKAWLEAVFGVIKTIAPK